MLPTKSSSANLSANGIFQAKIRWTSISAYAGETSSLWASSAILGMRSAKRQSRCNICPLDAGVEAVGTLVIRSSHDPEQFALPVQRIVSEMDPDLPVSDILTMNQLLGKSTLDQSFNTTLLVAFATLSLILAAVGLFGVMSYVAAQRTNEIGIRIALGAKREHVMRKMLLDGMWPAVVGLVVGLAASLEATPVDARSAL